MEQESNHSRMQLGCSPYGNGYQGLINKGSCQGRQAAGRPVHSNPVLSTKRKWQLSTLHQPLCSKSLVGEGVLQDGGTASTEILNIAGRLHDETGPEGCIICTFNSYLPQNVYEVHLSGQNIWVSLPSLWPAHSSSGIHKDTEASAGSVAVHGYLGFDLQRRHVITPPREQGAVENLCSRGRSSGKDGLSGEKREAIPRNCLRFPNNDTVPPSTQSYHHCRHLFSPFFFIVETYHHLLAQGSGSVRTLSTLNGDMRHASQCGTLDAPLHYRGLQCLHLQAVSDHGHTRIVIAPLTFQAHKDLQWWVSESSCHLNGCPTVIFAILFCTLFVSFILVLTVLREFFLRILINSSLWTTSNQINGVIVRTCWIIRRLRVKTTASQAVRINN